jgi:hypothetical protein
LLLIFPLPEQTSDEEIERSLFRGLEHLHKENPILRSWATRSAGGSSKYTLCEPQTVAESEEWIVGRAKLHCADALLPSFQELKEQGAAINLLSNSSLGPRPRIPQDTGPHPVFDFKATKIEGGVILCFLVLHKVLDGTSTGIIIHQFAEGSRHAFTRNSETSELIHTLEEGEEEGASISAFPQSTNAPLPPAPYRLLSDSSSPTQHTGHAVCKLFKLAANFTSYLKIICSDGQKSFISTNDAVSALIMHALTRARKVDPSKHPEVGTHFPVNIRSKLSTPISESKLGNYVLCARASIPTVQAFSDDIPALAATAAAIRRAITDLNSQKIEQILSWISSQPNNASSVDWHYSYYGEPGIDYGLVSWANMGLYDLDFGFGKPEFARVPGDKVFSDSCRILPRLNNGAQEIIMGLTEEEMKALEKDQLWSDWVEAYSTEAEPDVPD